MRYIINNDADYRLNRALLQSWRVKKFSYKNNARLDYGFLYVLSGRITYTFDDKRIELRAGDIIYLPKGSHYEAEFDISNGEVKNYLLNFDIVGEGESVEGDTPYLFYSDGAGAVESFFEDVVEAYRNKKEPLLIKSLFYLALHTLLNVCRVRDEKEEDMLIKKGAELLAERYSMTVEEIALCLHLSRSAFQKRFKESYGVSPVRYRALKRLERAKLYLGTTDMPIKEIAESLEFYDLSYFYRCFEKEFGVPPGVYRERRTVYL